ncbi:UNKNOWN [Stylonychia lemnae]|uniref:Uncharacterized protein n=1 Tax=Stylonychia lemnae TaxID=5949 RepID=A0A078AHA2_STYLE|nr:UNKNOWN [Stylonychia lemnae]|eukprot:CDW81665.1 UNKNOWN [Stylonychia lemnae]
MEDTEMAEEEECEVKSMQIDDQIYLEEYNNNYMQGLIMPPLQVSQMPIEEQKQNQQHAQINQRTSSPKFQSKQFETQSSKVSQTYDDLIMDQSSLGFWKTATIIQSFIDEDAFMDQNLVLEVKSLLSDLNAFEQVWITLLALYILQKKFSANKNEWQLVAQKGKDYIRSMGIQKPDNIVKKIGYKLI